ncbi:hypothetical protein [Nocardia blacklockiae]|uniref:hypothetical protein n=1 Tax=Nocardia blacklockiae TaxID=480036 RepID=UPI001895F4ED|nr:hypothetical protein [Nocardia blacklockiae]MBF6172362.1 hypothetical protein [Nocardia blacklockiae]
MTTDLAADTGTEVTLVLPRHTYSPIIGRLLHDHTADGIAAAISRIPNAAATIVPFDVDRPVEQLAHAHRGGESYLDTRRRTKQQPAQ